MSPWLKILVIFILFVGSISTVALLVDSSPAPLPSQEPILFDETPEPSTPEPVSTPEPPAEPATVSAPAPRSAPAPAPEPERTGRVPRGSSSVDTQSGNFEEGSDCSGDTDASGSGGTTRIESDEDEDC